MRTLNLEKQYDLLLKFLESVVTSDYVYLDMPMHFNIGDNFICLGALELLKKLPYKLKYISTVNNYDESKINESHCIIMHGGGNFGDLYPGATWYRNQIVERFPNNRIIFMPQSITYIDIDKIVEDSKICSQHKDLHIIARDNLSYLLLEKHFIKNNIYLLPDSAIGLYYKLPKQITNNKTKKDSLSIVRQDQEAIEYPSNSLQGDIIDWKDILNASLVFRVSHFLLRGINYLKKRLHLQFLYSLSNYIFINILYPIILKITCRKLLSYSRITSTRLHGYIIASLLHIPVTFIDTKYKKISNYFNTWKD